MRKGIFALAAIAATLIALLVPPATAAVGVDSEELRDAVTPEAIEDHLEAFDLIGSSNGGTRASGTPGYADSVEYVVETLEAAGYVPAVQTFTYEQWSETAPPLFAQLSPNAVVYADGVDFATMEYSDSGLVAGGMLEAVDLVLPPGPSANTSSSGCEAADFAGFTAGNVALIQRGTCSFAQKALNAAAADAAGVVIFNEGQPGRTDVLFGTLGGPGPTGVPVIGTSFAVGDALAGLLTPGPVLVDLQTTTTVVSTETQNVIAETEGRSDRVVVAGAHLDSVPEGPGVNDNGSGSATILEIAVQMAELGIEPRNQVRFAWWGAEESGLIGSEFYVSQLTSRDIKDIAVNLNFDMVGSPNYAPFVYDGDGSDTPAAGPNGSGVVEDVFLDYFGSMDAPTWPTAFDGRSDYGPFIAVGIPAGGLFTGAEGLKTQDQEDAYGGMEGVAYDVCYHQACDTIANVNMDAIDLMSDAAAHAVLTFAMTTSAVNGTGQGNGNGVGNLEFDGARRQR
ncbi:MAG TPA: M20/M25/M40 family metallo-hydrolase [Actinomycetota bacterium]|nr:M20/M25/M40 family metallo-hydrolase [Actinomycetota bacterium]